MFLISKTFSGAYDVNCSFFNAFSKKKVGAVWGMGGGCRWSLFPRRQRQKVRFLETKC